MIPSSVALTPPSNLQAPPPPIEQLVEELGAQGVSYISRAIRERLVGDVFDRLCNCKSEADRLLLQGEALSYRNLSTTIDILFSSDQREVIDRIASAQRQQHEPVAPHIGHAGRRNF